MQSYSIRGKSVKVHNDGSIFVNGNSTGIKQWSSSSTRYSNASSGSEIKEMSGLDIEAALMRKGWL